MTHFLIRLLPPRVTFPFDMTVAEADVMARHASYWRERMTEGRVVAYGPVMDPTGPWGLSIVEAQTDDEARALADNDPVVGERLGFRYEVLAMPRTQVRSG